MSPSSSLKWFPHQQGGWKPIGGWDCLSQSFLRTPAPKSFSHPHSRSALNGSSSTLSFFFPVPEAQWRERKATCKGWGWVSHFKFWLLTDKLSSKEIVSFYSHQERIRLVFPSSSPTLSTITLFNLGQSLDEKWEPPLFWRAVIDINFIHITDSNRITELIWKRRHFLLLSIILSLPGTIPCNTFS